MCADDAVKEDENAPKPWEEENGIYGIMVGQIISLKSVWPVYLKLIDHISTRKRFFLFSPHNHKTSLEFQTMLSENHFSGL